MLPTNNEFAGGETPTRLRRPGVDANDNPIRVWLVDDDASFRELLTELLHIEGGLRCVAEFDSAEAALEALEHELPPDVILLDNQLKGISGADAVHRFRDLTESTHVLMLTTFGDSQTRSRVLEDGASDFLLKRYTPDVIAERIRQAHSKPPVGVFKPAECCARTAGHDSAPPRWNWLDRVGERMAALGQKLSAAGRLP